MCRSFGLDVLFSVEMKNVQIVWSAHFLFYRTFSISLSLRMPVL